MKDSPITIASEITKHVRGTNWKRLTYLLGLFVLALFALFLGLTPEKAEAPKQPQIEAADPCSLDVVSCPEEAPQANSGPLAKPQEPAETQGRVIQATVYTYEAKREQTDDSPCFTADGTDVCPLPSFGVVANNCLPFGTEVRIQNRLYFVHDRMNSRYGCDVFDILTVGDNVYRLTNEPVTIYAPQT